MADTIASNVAIEILKKLGSLALQELGLVWGMKDELDKLRNTVSTIRAVLADAEERQAKNHEISDWLEKLNDAFYDADDLLDGFSTEILRRQVMTQKKRLKTVRVFFSSSNQLTFSFKMAHDIKAINERLDEISKDREKFHFSQQSIDVRVENIRTEETYSYVDTQRVIGRDADKKEIIKLLSDGIAKENASVVAIVGIGGLGKTTLAQMVYNDDRVTKHFDLKMWVHASNVFDVKLITTKIVESATSKELENLATGEKPEKLVTSKKPENLSMDELQEDLRKKIDGKKFLLVLDDVWNENPEKWLKLSDLLQSGLRGSKILVTTRNELVANVSGTNSPHILKGLSDDESWSLFKQMAFKNGKESENTDKVATGKEIVEKCKGVPLAIRAIGSLLCFKNTYAEWLVFKNNNLLKIAQEENVILPILKLSYDHLPSNLRKCFAFCSLYLKGEEIDKKELIQLWIAHGFIQQVYDTELEDIGDLYFMNLLRRSFFQDIKRDELGEIISCKIHDFVHDLAQSVASLEISILNSDANNVTQKTRHVSFGCQIDSSWKISTHLMRANKLRTFILKGEYSKIKVFGSIVSTFKCLRVLNMQNLEIEMVPSNISELKHLRYLDLSGNKMETLPNSINKLQNLQTLKLNNCSLLKKLSRDIKKLVSLRHLELDECDGLIGMPRGLGQLTGLLTLPWFTADRYSGLSELQSLNNLRGRLSIRIRHQRRRWNLKKATPAAEGRMEGTNYLEGKEYLKTLELDFQWLDHNDELLLESLRPHPNLKELIIRAYMEVSFPSWMMVDKIGLSSSLPNLVRIHMSGVKRCKHLPLFGQLPSLQFLTLWFMKSVEYMDNSSSGSGSGSGNGGEESLSSSSTAAAIRRSDPTTPTFFPSLKQLNLWTLPNLKGWWRSESATTTTETLPDQQQHLTNSLPSFPSLSKLTIGYCPNLASMPILQPCLERLVLIGVSKKLVQQVLRMTISPTPTISTVATSSSSSLLPLSNLKSLTLYSIEDLDDDDDMQFLQGLTNLTDLSISSIPKLVSLPVGLQHLTTLRTLEIQFCDNLMELPEWIGNLTSLERLEFYKCQKLTSLPDGVRQLTALQLKIESRTQVIFDS